LLVNEDNSDCMPKQKSSGPNGSPCCAPSCDLTSCEPCFKIDYYYYYYYYYYKP